jgi:hypothetical protein
MSDVLDGEGWKHAKPEQAAGVSLQQRTRAEQQAWLDEQYARRKITLREWRFQFDVLSMENADGSFPPIE